MTKRAFTMIELLAIIIILGIISIFAVPSISNLNKNTNYKEVYDTIYLATETYIYNNYDNYTVLDTEGATVRIYVIDLINNSYLKNSITNPKNNQKFTSQDSILVTRNENMTLSFELE